MEAIFAGEFHVGIDQVAASLDTVLGSVGASEERRMSNMILCDFARELLRAARADAGSLHRDTRGEAEFGTLLELICAPRLEPRRPKSKWSRRGKLATAARCSLATSAPKCSGVAASSSRNASR